MRFEDAKGLATMLTAQIAVRPMPKAAAAMAARTVGRSRLWCGVVPSRRPQGCRLAIRAQRRTDLALLPKQIQALSPAEKDVRITGVLRALRATGTGPPSPGDLQERIRPLRPGHSIGHFRITAGTLGALVEGRSDGVTRMLSNNHVLADCNKGLLGDPILQPGRSDGGCDLGDAAGTLHSFVPLAHTENRADAALADIFEDAMPDDMSLPGIGSVTSWWTEDAPEVTAVQKVGRTTGLTHGRITAIGVGGSQVPVRYDDQTLWFSDPIEVMGIQGSFSEPGDSGSLVVDADRSAVGLLFAGDGTATYCNRIADVLDALDADLLR
jgi:hypothetical protein